MSGFYSKDAWALLASIIIVLEVSLAWRRKNPNPHDEIQQIIQKKFPNAAQHEVDAATDILAEAGTKYSSDHFGLDQGKVYFQDGEVVKFANTYGAFVCHEGADAVYAEQAKVVRAYTSEIDALIDDESFRTLCAQLYFNWRIDFMERVDDELVVMLSRGRESKTLSF